MNQTRPHCVNQMGKTHSKPLAARHGRGTALARHAMCKSALKEMMPCEIGNEYIYIYMCVCVRACVRVCDTTNVIGSRTSFVVASVRSSIH
jgi:hypothetical protein